MKVIDEFVSRGEPVKWFDGSRRYCTRGRIGPAPTAVVVDRQRTALNPALEWFTDALEKGYAGQTEMLGQRMTEMAGKNAFTQVDWTGRGSSPGHWQANLLKNVAMGVNIVDQSNSWTNGNRNAVIEWGTKIATINLRDRDAGFHDNWPDEIATGAGFFMWGVAAGSEKYIAEGLAIFDKVARQIGPRGETFFFLKNPERYADGVERKWLMSIDDKTIGDLVLTAHAARGVGLNLFNRRVGEGTVYEAVVAWQDVLFGPPTSLTRGQRRDFLRTFGGERSWAWTEYFIENYPSDPQTARLRNENRRIAGGAGYRAMAQGPSSCLTR